ncbi:hypothetical protein LMIY3S_03646 [Labrys miyagiensis]
MRPEANAARLLAVTRSKAKMYEYDVPPSDHIALPQRPELLFALVVGLLGDAAAAIASGNIAEGREQPTHQSLIFAATYFEAYNESRLDGDVAAEFSLLGAATYYLADNPGSAHVVARAINPPSIEFAAGLALLCYRLLLSEYASIGETVRDILPDQILASMASYLSAADGEADILGLAQQVRDEAYRWGDSRELLYADIAAAIVRKKIETSARTILPGASGLPLNLWQPALQRAAFPRELWPSQQRICAAGVLRGASAVVQMPTSAGKTRATELILRSAFLSGRASPAVIVCPFRSLCHDIRGDIARAFSGENIALNEATDSFQQDLDVAALWGQRTVLIVTPEKLLYLLRREPSLGQNIGVVIYDEGHQFDSGARGVTYELLLTSLKLSLALNTQIVLISAVIANAGKIAGWLLGNEEAVVDGAGLLPTARRVAFTNWTTQLGQLQYVAPLDPDDIEFFVPRVIEQTLLGKLPRERTDRHFPTPGDGSSIGLYLGLKLARKGSVAVFCGRKDTAVGICSMVVDLFRRTTAFIAPASHSDRDEVEKLTALFLAHVGPEAPTTKSAALGIFPHHSSVPNGLRLSIEYAMKTRRIHVVICTSTLAQGVNLPIRYLIVTGVHQGGEQMLVRDFHNLIGRAGRAGMHTEGSIIFADSKVFDKRRDRRERWRWRVAKELLNPANSEPSSSSISTIFLPFEFGEPPRSLTLTADLLHNLVFEDEVQVEGTVAAMIAQEPSIDGRKFRNYLEDRVKVVHGIASFLLAHLDFAEASLAERAVDLARNTLAHFLSEQAQKDQLETVFRTIAERILAETATEDLRAMLRRSPLAPTIVNSLKAWLDTNRAALEQALQDGTLSTTVAAVMLSYNRSSSVTSLSDQQIMADVVQRWMNGANFADIHVLLVQRGIRIGGNNRHPTVEDAVAICESGLGYEGAMIVATLADLAEEDGNELPNELALIQRMLKCGLPTRAALGFFEAGFADRVVAAALAVAFPNVLDRQSARLAVRGEVARAREVLGRFPSYFESILDEFLT